MSPNGFQHATAAESCQRGDLSHDQHTIHLPVIRYRDAAGNPTCATDFEAGEICAFYRTQRMGAGETCVFAETKATSKHADNMRRRDGAQGPGTGTLIPGAWCPVWRET